MGKMAKFIFVYKFLSILSVHYYEHIHAHHFPFNLKEKIKQYK